MCPMSKRTPGLMRMTNHAQQRHLAYWLALSELEGFSYRAAIELLQLYGGFEQALRAPSESLAASLPILAQSIKSSRVTQSIVSYEETVSKVKTDGVSIITMVGAGYPQRLLRIPDPPLTLFFRGNMPNLDTIGSVAIVGTREPSNHGRRLSYEMARTIASAGYVIISGLAFGVDAEAHIGAMDAGGKTLAVLPSYVNDIMPKGNIDIAERILESGGALVSEYLPGVPPTPDKFIARNRIIAALAESTIIVEGTLKSGTRHQARYAQELGRPLFVLAPRDRSLPTAELPLHLEREGATSVMDENDALRAVRKARQVDTVQTKLE